MEADALTDLPAPAAPSVQEKAAPQRPGSLKSLAFVGVTLLFLLAAVEGVWRLVCLSGLTLPPTGDRSLIQEWQWIQSHGRGEKDVFSGTQFRFDPELGWFPKPNFRSDGINTNSHGQRGLADYPTDRNPGKKRILFIGDSYTFGFEVRDEESYPAVLGSHLLPGAEIINWGVPGYGTDQQVLLYEREGVKFHPDVVVLGFYTRDLFRNDTWFRSYAKPMFELTGESLALASREIPSPTDLLRLYSTGKRRIQPEGLYLAEYLKRMVAKFQRREVEGSAAEWKLTSKILERFADRARAEGSKPFLLIIPHDEILEKTGSATEDTARLLSAESEKLGMPCLDLIPVFREKSKADPRPLYKGHLSPWGNEVTAEALFEALKKVGLV
jgi:hypothetical protein